MRFVVVGAYVTDCFVRTPKLPVWGSEYEVQSVRTSPGGKALNQAVALARLGAHVTAVGVVGDDACGSEILDALSHDGIDISCIERRAKVSTAVCVCLVGDKGESSILWHIDDDVAVRPSTIDAAAQAMRHADTVLLTFEMPSQSIRATICTASDHRARVVVQPAPALYDGDEARSLPWDRVDVLVPNEAEARALLNDPHGDVPSTLLAEALARQVGVPTVAVTLGASGCVVYAGDRSRAYPAPDVVPVDTTGAGDAFVATLAAHLTAGTAVEDAVHMAQSAAALAIQRPGGHETMPSY